MTPASSPRPMHSSRLGQVLRGGQHVEPSPIIASSDRPDRDCRRLSNTRIAGSRPPRWPKRRAGAGAPTVPASSSPSAAASSANTLAMPRHGTKFAGPKATSWATVGMNNWSSGLGTRPMRRRTSFKFVRLISMPPISIRPEVAVRPPFRCSIGDLFLHRPQSTRSPAFQRSRRRRVRRGRRGRCSPGLLP